MQIERTPPANKQILTQHELGECGIAAGGQMDHDIRAVARAAFKPIANQPDFARGLARGINQNAMSLAGRLHMAILDLQEPIRRRTHCVNLNRAEGSDFGRLFDQQFIERDVAGLKQIDGVTVLRSVDLPAFEQQVVDLSDLKQMLGLLVGIGRSKSGSFFGDQLQSGETRAVDLQVLAIRRLIQDANRRLRSGLHQGFVQCLKLRFAGLRDGEFLRR